MCTWRVPRQFDVTETLTITARSVPAGVAADATVRQPHARRLTEQHTLRAAAHGYGCRAPKGRSCQAYHLLRCSLPQLSSVKVVKPRSRLEVARVGHAEVEARRPP